MILNDKWDIMLQSDNFYRGHYDDVSDKLWKFQYISYKYGCIF